MAVYNKFLSSHGLHTAIQPHDLTGAASNGTWLNMEGAETVTFVVSKGAWAGGTPAITLEQAQTVAGLNPKPVAFTEAWTKGSATDATWQRQVVTGNSFNMTAIPNTMTALEISAQQLDRNNGYKAIRIIIGTPGANADLASVLAIFASERYQSDPTTLRSHLVD
jgi:hypothetical protein